MIAAQVRPGRTAHPDWGKSTRDRAERLRRPVRLVEVEQADDGLRGLPQYAAAGS